jgi:2,3-dihydroxyphenylpropionate 1,2-dioxygenase
LLDYTDAQTYADAGQGGFEIRTLIAAAAAARSPAPSISLRRSIFSTGCFVATAEIA